MGNRGFYENEPMQRLPSLILKQSKVAGLKLFKHPRQPGKRYEKEKPITEKV
jgi:hypothetical protein